LIDNFINFFSLLNFFIFMLEPQNSLSRDFEERPWEGHALWKLVGMTGFLNITTCRMKNGHLEAGGLFLGLQGF
jgi:hypothetical protein